jgi:hypothetical protein
VGVGLTTLLQRSVVVGLVVDTELGLEGLESILEMIDLRDRECVESSLLSMESCDGDKWLNLVGLEEAEVELLVWDVVMIDHGDILSLDYDVDEVASWVGHDLDLTDVS